MLRLTNRQDIQDRQKRNRNVCIFCEESDITLFTSSRIIYGISVIWFVFAKAKNVDHYLHR
jgi:hypothetical protein